MPPKKKKLNIDDMVAAFKSRESLRDKKRSLIDEIKKYQNDPASYTISPENINQLMTAIQYNPTAISYGDNTYITSTANMPPHPNSYLNPRRQHKFKVGDEVVGNKYAVRYSYTGPGVECVVVNVRTDLNPGEDDMIVEVIDSRLVPSILGSRHRVCSDSFDFKVRHAFMGGLKQNAVPLSIEALEKLSMPMAKKEQIMAVLMQTSHADTLFNEWGLADTIEYGRGTGFLFWGEPGTGKTFAARLMAKALGRELLILSMAEIQSSEPGAANRNLQQAFATATSENKVLLLDECDSLVYDRKYMGMILGGEINTLLTEIEKFEGVLIMTTNRIESLDPALERRIALIMEFENPNFEERIGIWKMLIPSKMPLAKDVNYKKLAEHEITGGLIKNAVLNAARRAIVDANGSKDGPVRMKHFEDAVQTVKQSQNLMGKGDNLHENRGKGKVDYVSSISKL